MLDRSLGYLRYAEWIREGLRLRANFWHLVRKEGLN